jgi:hypothetical protein
VKRTACCYHNLIGAVVVVVLLTHMPQMSTPLRHLVRGCHQRLRARALSTGGNTLNKAGGSVDGKESSATAAAGGHADDGASREQEEQEKPSAHEATGASAAEEAAAAAPGTAGAAAEDAAKAAKAAAEGFGSWVGPGLAPPLCHSRYYCASKHIQSMTSRMARGNQSSDTRG